MRLSLACLAWSACRIPGCISCRTWSSAG